MLWLLVPWLLFLTLAVCYLYYRSTRMASLTDIDTAVAAVNVKADADKADLLAAIAAVVAPVATIPQATIDEITALGVKSDANTAEIKAALQAKFGG